MGRGHEIIQKTNQIKTNLCIKRWLMETNNYLKQLIEISERKLDLLMEIYSLTLEQNEAIKAGRFDEVERLIGQKQSRMDLIDKLDEQFLYNAQKLKDQFSVDSLERLADFNLSGAKELKEIVVKINEQLKSIRQLDDENTGIIKKEMEETGETINHVNTFKQAARAYNPVTPETPSYFFDRKK